MSRWRVFFGGIGLLVLAAGCPGGSAGSTGGDAVAGSGGTRHSDHAGTGGSGLAANEVDRAKQGTAGATQGGHGGHGGSSGQTAPGQAAGSAARGGTGGRAAASEDDAGVAEESCPGNVPLPAICRVCDDGSCGKPICKAGKPTGEYRCPTASAACSCDSPSVPVCGTDGKDYDAACGASCVPVAVACQGKCPCQAQSSGACVVGGCSSQLCTEASAGGVISTCEWREAYACYRTASCARQSTGKCGWTPTPELNACLQNAGAQP
jgi:hypothetical protein